MQIPAHIATLGTETAFEVLARAQALAARGRSVINLGIGQPDFPTAPHIVEAACRALVDGHHGYTPANGIPPLREAIVADLDRRLGVAVDPPHLLREQPAASPEAPRTPPGPPDDGRAGRPGDPSPDRPVDPPPVSQRAGRPRVRRVPSVRIDGS